MAIEIYENTAENAERIGWNRVREVLGDPSKPYVFHATKYGIFFYIDEDEKKIVECSSESDIRIGLR